MKPLYSKYSDKSIHMKQLREELIRDEGIVYAIYLDHLQNPTVGIGHLIQPNDPEYNLPVGTPVSKERVQELFSQDIQTAINDCYALYGIQFEEWPREVKHVLVNMMFNMGRSSLRKFSRMKRALIHRNWKRAAAEGRDSLWYRQVTSRAERLMKRLEEV